ncbi:ribonuclease P protein subunit p30 isoform X2 [Melitaea cinxia]|uniref:ribonuclease P protein subunit p30 isoform X2 n=1 Tax=Melitaea cinxia TaxID=113334 RepID=UPI001E274B57|nr:ribonuclease P protein subunit p30 isoform X2 [Melitaea cinxia]
MDTTQYAGFCDLNIDKMYDINTLSFIEKQGFQTVAINTHVEEVNVEEPKKKKKKNDPKDKKDHIPPPLEIPDKYACGTLDTDVITFDPLTRIPFKVSRKLYRQAVERGIFFEIMYSPAIRDSTSRRNIITTSHLYHAVGKSKNIIITSGAKDNTQVRGIYDVINLGFIFGLNNNESLEVVRNNPHRLILKAQGRRCGKHYMEVSQVGDQCENKIPKE